MGSPFSNATLYVHILYFLVDTGNKRICVILYCKKMVNQRKRHSMITNVINILLSAINLSFVHF